MENAGLLKSAHEHALGRTRRMYRITAAGKKALNRARVKVNELYHELHEENPRMRQRRARSTNDVSGSR